MHGILRLIRHLLIRLANDRLSVVAFGRSCSRVSCLEEQEGQDPFLKQGHKGFARM
jgi:hypothetical protein